MPIGHYQLRASEIVGVSYLVVNPGFEKSLHSGCLPNMSIGTSLHRYNTSQNKFSSFLSLATIRNKNWRSTFANYLGNNADS